MQMQSNLKVLTNSESVQKDISYKKDNLTIIVLLPHVDVTGKRIGVGGGGNGFD